MKTLPLAVLAIAGVAAKDKPNEYTASKAAPVYAAQATAPTSQKTSHVRGKAFDRFITIWLENTDYEKAAGDPNLAALATKGITLFNYFAVTHPSEPNYCASHGGDNFGMDNDDFNQIHGNVSAVTALLEDKGISWGSYQEDMPYTGFEGDAWINQDTKANDYVRKHNPPVLYNSNTSPQRLSYQKNLTMFYEDLKAEKLPQWLFITPNMTNDGHDTSVTVAGKFCKRFLGPLLENKYFTDRTLILITFDENHTYQRANKVFSILLGGAVPEKLVGTVDHNFYNHYSEISTVEANWNLHTLGRWDVGANVFELVAEHTGDVLRTNEGATSNPPTLFYNSSFAGPFNDDFEKAPYPAPNLNIKSPKTERTVLPAIVEAWGGKKARRGRFDRRSAELSTYYTDSVVVPDGQHPPPGYKVNNVDK